MSPGQRITPGGQTEGDPEVITATTPIVPRTTPVVVDGQPARVVLDAGLTLDDLHAAFLSGCEYGRAENISAEAKVEARRLLLAQAGEWRSATYALAIANGPSWAAMMLEVIDGDDSEVA